jgi:S-adenosylmethionine-dependent methyltransferase
MMPWYGYLRRTIVAPDERRHFADVTFVEDLRDRGIFRNDVPGRFTNGYGFRPAEIVPYFEGFGLSTVTLATTHGFATGIEDQLLAMRDENPGAYDAAMRLLIETADDPSLFGLAGHLLYIAALGTVSPP